MSPRRAPRTFLEEFRAFIAFLGSLWGLLAGISVFFPLSNNLVQVVPLQSIAHAGVFVTLTPLLVTTVATTVTLFVILSTFSGHRFEFGSKPNRRAIQRQAMISFGLGLFMLMLYLIGYSVTRANAYDVWGWQSQDPRHLWAEIPLLISYVAWYALIARAFVLLGMMEFLSRR